mmetsp:Transcript_13715/g.15911  ORF Transcript_13715/g.15911 Transcript_13715/m.15911 type:complete len:96 (-) Transcript_13715:100-387(-)
MRESRSEKEKQQEQDSLIFRKTDKSLLDNLAMNSKSRIHKNETEQNSVKSSKVLQTVEDVATSLSRNHGNMKVLKKMNTVTPKGLRRKKNRIIEQ